MAESRLRFSMRPNQFKTKHEAQNKRNHTSACLTCWAEYKTKIKLCDCGNGDIQFFQNCQNGKADAGGEMTEIALTFPWAPPVNTYWHHVMVNGRPVTMISKKGREFRKVTAIAILGQVAVLNRPSDRLTAHVLAYLPGRHTKIAIRSFLTLSHHPRPRCQMPGAK